MIEDERTFGMGWCGQAAFGEKKGDPVLVERRLVVSVKKPPECSVTLGASYETDILIVSRTPRPTV